jgi:glycosyltransferase involved in cell wall biosynthesis
MTTVEVAIPTWNRRDDLRRAIDSARRQRSVADLRIVVYDNGSTDGTPEVVLAAGGDVSLRRWSDNRGRHRNISRPFAESSADLLLVLFDDEELLPEGLSHMVEALEQHPAAVFATGLRQRRRPDGVVLDPSGLQAPPTWRPPAFQTGRDFIRTVFTMGDYTWFSSCMFRLDRIRPARLLEQDNPCDDTGLLLRAALRGPVLHVDHAVATQTDGNDGASAQEGLVDVVGSHNELSLAGCLGYRRVLERFLLEDARSSFGPRERRALLAAAERTSAGLAGLVLGDRLRRVGLAPLRTELGDELLWFRRPRSRVRLLRNALLAWQRQPA